MSSDNWNLGYPQQNVRRGGLVHIELVEIASYNGSRMEISQEAKAELKQIYFKQTGDLLTDQEVEAMAQGLFCLFEVVYRPLPKSSSKKNDVNPLR